MLKLWEKNYILTISFILIILYGSIFFVAYDTFQKNFTMICDNAEQTVQGVAVSIQSLLNETSDDDMKMIKLKYYCQTMKRQNIYIRLCQNEDVLVDFLPIPVPDSKQPARQIIKAKSDAYLCILNSFHYQNTPVTITYVEAVDRLYTSQQKQICLLLAGGALIAFLLAGILYFSIKKIYQPVNNIAHELRTPLTSIQGYAQYILLGRLNEKEIQYASSQIDKESHYINEIIERLLIMANIRKGELCYEKVYLPELLEALKIHYPSLLIKNDIQYITGDKILLSCLLMNLLSNCSRSGTDIRLTVSQIRHSQRKLQIRKPGHKPKGYKKICIRNQNDFLDAKMIKILNSNRTIPKEKIHGKGLGVSLCHEIVNLHHGKLIYESSKTEGVTVTVLLPDTV